MGRKRSYKRESVNKVDVEWLRDCAVGYGDAGTTVGLDIAKGEIVSAVPGRRRIPEQADRIQRHQGLPQGMEGT